MIVTPPELLPEFEPELAEPWEQAPVRLRYRYEARPPGLLPRFIFIASQTSLVRPYIKDPNCAAPGSDTPRATSRS